MSNLRFNFFKGLPESIYVLLVAQTICGFGNFVAPYLSLYLNTNLGINKDLIGIFISVSTISFIPGVVIGGKLSDHYSKKKILIVSRLLSSLCLIFVLFASNIYIILVFICLFTLFSAAASPSIDSLIADFTKGEQRKRAYSLTYLGYNLGGAVGCLLAGYAFQSYPDMIFIGESASILISVFLIILKVKEPKRETLLEKEENKEYNSGNSILILLKQPVLLTYIMLSACYTFSYAQNFFCLPLFIDSNFPDTSSYYFGILMTVNSICVICFTAFITKLTVKLSPVFNMFINGLFYAVGFGMHFVATNFYLIILATVFWTLGEILFNTNFTLFVVEKSPYAFRGRLISIASLITRSAITLNPLVMGKIMQNGGTRIVWLVVFFIMAAASSGMFYLSLLERRHKTNTSIRAFG